MICMMIVLTITCFPGQTPEEQLVADLAYELKTGG